MLYIGAWIAYLFAALLLGIAWWRFTGRMAAGFWRSSLRWMVAAMLFTPAASMPGEAQLAPAYIVLVFGMASEGWEVAEPGARALGTALGLGIAVIAVSSLVNRIRGSSQ